MLGCICHYIYTSFLRFFFKWLLRQLTGKCELQRICAGYKAGAARTTRTEYSLESSKSKVLRASVSAEGDAVKICVEMILKEKYIKEQKDPTFKKNLVTCLLQITGYKNLYQSVEQLRKEVYDSDREDHEKMLLRCSSALEEPSVLKEKSGVTWTWTVLEDVTEYKHLWDLLMPSKKLESRITKQWGDIGFQGDDPKTDFRGMGMLGLTNLVYFSENYTEAARQVLSRANHPKLGYSYAIVGINLTEMAYSLLKNGTLKPHFYNSVDGSPQMSHFHELYCYLAYEFNKFWIEEEPESIMEFNLYREKFHEKVKRLLLDPSVSLILKVDSKN